MTIHERQEIAEAILNELHFRRYNEAISNGCNEKDAMILADNWELYKDAQDLFKFYVDLANVSQATRTVCHDCGDRGWLYDDEGRRTGTCPCYY